MKNKPPPEKQNLEDGRNLDVHSIFHTLQGEGPFVGVPAIFVRLAGCNLQCPRCDTNYTSRRKLLSVEEIVSQINTKRESTTTLIVITGGEPFRQNLLPFVGELLTQGFRIQIETNGTLFQDLPYEQITIVCSPKTGSINTLLAPHLSALKYVLAAGDADDDYLPTRALEHGSKRLARPPKDFKGAIYIQPFDSGDILKNVEHRNAAMTSCFKTGNTLCLQVHKLIGLE